MHTDQSYYWSSSRIEKLMPLRDVIAPLAQDVDTEVLLQTVMKQAMQLLNAERSTLFLVDEERQELWSKIAHGLEIEEIRMPRSSGIAGSVASSGNRVNLSDAYTDARFNAEVDRQTGYRTRTLLCLPVCTAQGTTVGVIQVLNKRDGVFTAEDEETLARLCTQAAILIQALMVSSS